MTLDEDDRRTRALRYASFLLHIDSLLHRGLDLTNWFAGPGRRELAALENPVWDLLNQVFLYLCSHGSLVVSDILTQVVYPIWAATAAVDTADISSGLTRSALPANRLFEALLLDAEVPTHTASVISLADTYNLHAQRKDVHRSPHFVQLLRGVITLNSMEQNTYLPDEIRQSSKILHSTLIIDNLFRQGLYAEYERLRPNSRDSSREPDDDDMIVDFDPAERASLFQTIRSYLSTDALCGEYLSVYTLHDSSIDV
jgi:mediator of RNA polymerase II transcription subunit 12, fungi type